MNPIEVTVTCATADEARTIMEAVVGRRLAACAQTWPIESCFRWDGDIDHDREHLVLMKTTDACFEAVCAAIAELHSYDLPAIAALPLSHCGPGYEEWLAESVAAR
ncbi:divalent-cation tolerance protein CutA [Candidatus Poriferisocius sp.]|uniref:divalent-cation tolerance protein CutA n=1 Tax=Candidatus Poriferisocius sp. TaxID=3101276 RepID=UPI003B5BFDBD